MEECQARGLMTQQLELYSELTLPEARMRLVTNIVKPSPLDRWSVRRAKPVGTLNGPSFSVSQPGITTTSFIGMPVLSGTLCERQPNGILVEAELHAPNRTFFAFYLSGAAVVLLVGFILTTGHFLVGWTPRSDQGGPIWPVFVSVGALLIVVGWVLRVISYAVERRSRSQLVDWLRSTLETGVSPRRDET